MGTNLLTLIIRATPYGPGYTLESFCENKKDNAAIPVAFINLSKNNIMDTMEKEEFHENGTLKYLETIVILPKYEEHLFENRRQHPDGYSWIRTGRQAKYFDNGQLAWVLNYDKNGSVIKENNISYRKDGTIIQY